MSSKTKWFLILLFIVTTGYHSFGYTFYWVYIPVFSVKFTEGLFALLVLMFLTIMDLGQKRVNWFDTVLMPFTFLIVFTLIQALRAFFIQDVAVGEVVGKTALFLCLFFIFPLAYQIQGLNNLKTFLKMIIWLGIISSIISIIQVVFPAFVNVDYRTYEEMTRVGNTAMVIAGFTNIYSVSYLLLQKQNKESLYKTALILSSIAIILTLSRALIFSVLVSNIFIIFYYSFFVKTSFGVFFRVTALSLAISVLIGFVVYFLNYDISAVKDRFVEGFDDYQKGRVEHSSVGYRTEMTAIKVTAVMNESPFVGMGFNFIHDKSIKRGYKGYYEHYFHPNTLNGDATIPNIMILYGLLGIGIYLFLLVSIFLNSRSLFRKTNNTFLKILLFTIMPMPFYILINSFGTSYILNKNQIFLVIISTMLYAAKSYILTLNAKISQ